MTIGFGEHALVFLRHSLEKDFDSFRNLGIADTSFGKLIGFRRLQIRFLEQCSRGGECFLASGKKLPCLAEVFGLDVFDESIRDGFLGVGDTQLDWHVLLFLTLIPQDSSISVAVFNNSVRMIRNTQSSGVFSGHVMKSSHLDVSGGSRLKGASIL